MKVGGRNREGRSVHAQSPRQCECCAALGRERRLTGSLRFPVPLKYRGGSSAARPCSTQGRKSVHDLVFLAMSTPTRLKFRRMPPRIPSSAVGAELPADEKADACRERERHRANDECKGRYEKQQHEATRETEPREEARK